MPRYMRGTGRWLQDPTLTVSCSIYCTWLFIDPTHWTRRSSPFYWLDSGHRQCICSRVPLDLKLMEGRLNICISSCEDIIYNFCHFSRYKLEIASFSWGFKMKSKQQSWERFRTKYKKQNKTEQNKTKTKKPLLFCIWGYFALKIVKLIFLLHVTLLNLSYIIMVLKERMHWKAISNKSDCECKFYLISMKYVAFL